MIVVVKCLLRLMVCVVWSIVIVIRVMMILYVIILSGFDSCLVSSLV